MFFNLNNFTTEEWNLYESLPQELAEEVINLNDVEDTLYELGFPTALIKEHIDFLVHYQEDYEDDYAN